MEYILHCMLECCQAYSVNSCVNGLLQTSALLSEPHHNTRFIDECYCTTKFPTNLSSNHFLTATSDTSTGTPYPTQTGGTPGDGCSVGSISVVRNSAIETVFVNGGDSEEEDIPLAIGVGVGGVVVAVAVLVIIIGMTVVIRKAPKQTKEAPFYDYLTSHQSPALPERIQLEENIAYESTHPQA